VTLALLSAAVYAGVGAYVTTRQPPIASILVTVGALGALMFCFVLVQRWDELLPGARVLLAGAYAVAIAVRGGRIDEAAPLVGAGLLLCGELAAWSIDERFTIAAERAVVASRAVAVALLTLAGIAVSAIVLSLAAAPVGGGLGWTFLGAAASVLVVALTVRLAR
jgi:hypothetical protein